MFLSNCTFQKHLKHGSLPYSEAAHVDDVLNRFPGGVCSEAQGVFRSREYQFYFDIQRALLPDRSIYDDSTCLGAA